MVAIAFYSPCSGPGQAGISRAILVSSLVLRPGCDLLFALSRTGHSRTSIGALKRWALQRRCPAIPQCKRLTEVEIRIYGSLAELVLYRSMRQKRLTARRAGLTHQTPPELFPAA